MTWNLWWRFGPWEARWPGIVEVVRAVDPDVLFLQEVYTNDEFDAAVELAGACELHALRSTAASRDGESLGNAVLSRWPLDRVADERLPGSDGAPGHRTVLAALTATPWGPWPVATTHLDYLFDASATRQLQVHHLLERALVWRGDPDRDLPLIVGADLNAVPDSDEIRTLTGRRPGVPGIVFSDVWEQVGAGPGVTWRSDNPHRADSTWPDRRLDYLLVSWPRPKPIGNPVRAWIAGDAPIEGTWPSDHLAVVAELVTPDE